ncbi:T9SS type A sorting domain-containing protein [Winogradskyella costae]|uniref:T9SS type A sorting domain-containing protein n=1 Tax=Winogradskyella costae TaxID=2697008 RepID=UPI0015CEB6D1|nr:lamin tail domain-containing protein [Winogradskyella costae]
MKNLYLLLIALCLSNISFAQTTADAWINEIHYDNVSNDINEGVEIVITNTTTYPLENWSIVIYNGSTGTTNGTINYTISSSTNIDSASGFTTAWQPHSGLQNEVEALALVYNGTTLVQFISYEGIVTATGGIADGSTSVDIGVSETNTTALDLSLQLSGSGTTYSNFTWQAPATATTGTINNGQSFVPCTTPINVSSFTATGGDLEVDLDWVNGTCFDEVMIVAKNGSAVTAVPTGDGSLYNADAIFSFGTEIEPDEYIVYKGTGVYEEITGLINSDTYYFKIFARKGTSWSTGIEANATPDLIVLSNSIIITEIMINPGYVGDTSGEYFEVYNTTDTDIDMAGWTISDTQTPTPNDIHVITPVIPATTVIVPAYGFAVLGRNSDSATNGGIVIDYEYSGFNIANDHDEIAISDLSGTLTDVVEYDDDGIWPSISTSGQAMIYTGSNIEDNNDGSLWTFATVSEGIDVDHGSPGINGTDQIVSYLIYVNAAWNLTPSELTDTRIAYIRKDESTTFSTDVDLNNLFIEEGASLTINTGVTLTATTVTLESASDRFSSLISDGTISGTVNYERFVNTLSTGTGGNDLISLPLMPIGLTFDTFITNGDNATEITDNSTFYAFAPYNNTNVAYENFLMNATDVLLKAKGYRAATDSGDLLTFSGTPDTGTVNITIDKPNLGSEWNLIGNPYTSYVDADAFLSDANSALLDPFAVAIYAYNSGIYGGEAPTISNFTVINKATISTLTEENFNIAPGQGFFVASNDTGGSIAFTPDMRTLSGDDDYIAGRTSNESEFFKLNLMGSQTYSTSIFFNSNASLGLDPGYDAAVYGEDSENYPIFSHLVEENTGRAMALQAIDNTDLTSVSIPLGVNANQGEAITFSIDASNLSNTTLVYLEDTVANTYTLLNSGDYTLTPSINLSGTGRFYLQISNSTLSTIDNTLDQLNIYNNRADKTIIIAGQLSEPTTASVYDVQGRIVSTTKLLTADSTQAINVSQLNNGIYVVKVHNATQNKIQKVILR